MTTANLETNASSRKRLLYVAPQFPVLSQTFIEREVSKLVQLGNLDVTVFSFTSGSGETSAQVKSRTHYERLSVSICISALFSYVLAHPKKLWRIHKLILGKDKTPYLVQLKKDSQAIADALDKHSVLGRFHRARLVQFFKGVAYAKLFEKHQPDHIRVNFLSDTSTVVMVAAEILNVPFSISAHAKDVVVEGSLIATKAKEASFITVCNENIWKEVIREANKTASSGRVHLLYHGFDAAKEYSKPLGIEKPQRLTIFMGGTRLTEKKGIKYMIEASKALKDRGVDHQVDLVGTGPLREELMQQVNSLDLQESVFFHGGTIGTPFSRVAQYYRVADMLVLPNIQTDKGDVDGVPTVLIEAAFAKLPIITTAAGSTTDLIVDGKTGIIIEQKNSGAIVNAIVKLIADKTLAKQLGEAAYQKAGEMFNLDQNIAELEKLILANS